MPVIQRRSHPAVRRFRELHRREARHTRECFLLEGVKLVREALLSGLVPVEAMISQRLARSEGGRSLQAELAATAHVASDDILGYVSAAESHQGVLAVMPIRRHELESVSDPQAAPFLLLADGIQDPGNLGALIRISEGFGCGALLAAGGADPWSPKGVRAAAGSIVRHPVVAIGVDAVAATLSKLRERGYRRVAAVPAGGRDPAEGWRSPLVLVVGSEGGGLDAATLAEVDEQVTIPLVRPIESLNVATATAILAYLLSRGRPG